MQGLVNNNCQVDGTWAHIHAPTCQPKSCTTPPDLRNGKWWPLDTAHLNDSLLSTFNVGVRLKPACDDGYTLSFFIDSIQCLTSLTWDISSAPVCEPVKCPPLVIENAQTYGAITYNSSIMICCSPGYLLSDNSTNATLYCTSAGSWPQPLPQCNALNCGEPLFVEHAQYWTHGTSYNDTVEYICDHGYTLIGGRYMTCGINGAWTFSEMPSCVHVTCKHPGSVKNGNIYSRKAEVSIFSTFDFFIVLLLLLLLRFIHHLLETLSCDNKNLFNIVFIVQIIFM